MTTQDTATGEHTRPNARRIVAGIVAAIALLALGRWAGGYVPQVRIWVEGLGPWGPVGFIAVYALAAVAMVPASLLTLGAGAIFGVLAGTLYVFVAAVIGSSIAFLIARYVARSTVERRLHDDERFAAVDRAIAAEGRKIVLLLRLSPVFPFNLLNYALGLSHIGFRDYLIASVGMIPATMMYVYLGSLGGDVAATAGGEAATRSTAEWGLLVVGLAATVAVTISITRIARKALAEATQ